MGLSTIRPCAKPYQSEKDQPGSQGNQGRTRANRFLVDPGGTAEVDDLAADIGGVVQRCEHHVWRLEVSMEIAEVVHHRQAGSNVLQEAQNEREAQILTQVAGQPLEIAEWNEL